MKNIPIKNDKEIRIMRDGGIILSRIMDRLEVETKDGTNTLDLDKLAEKLVFDSGSKPAFKGYGKDSDKPFPATICASLNDEIVHGVPANNKIARSGDLLKVDIGLLHKGFYLDMARTFMVGGVSKVAEKLVRITEKSFWVGVEKIRNGAKLSDYSKAVQKYVENQGFSVVRNLVGHGIGRKLHEDPQVQNYYSDNYDDVELKSGMTLALEPMVNEGGHEIKTGKGGWVFLTKDKGLSAHYENTILVTEKGVEVLTK